MPVFSTSAAEIDSSGKGSNCQTQFNSQSLTFTFKSSLQPTFNVELAFHVANNLSSSVVTNVLSDASQLMTLINSSARTPAALASWRYWPTRPLRRWVAGSTQQSGRNWTNVNNLTFATTRSIQGTTTGIDQITFKMPPVNAGAGGVVVSNQWNVGGPDIADMHSHEKFRQGATWIDRDDVMDFAIVPSSAAGNQSTLDDLLLNGTVTKGFKLDGLNSATTVGSLRTSCTDLRAFLGEFLIEDDSLVARICSAQEFTLRVPAAATCRFWVLRYRCRPANARGLPS